MTPYLLLALAGVAYVGIAGYVMLVNHALEERIRRRVEGCRVADDGAETAEHADAVLRGRTG